MINTKKMYLLLWVVLTAFNTAHAQTQYVSDELEVTMRTGPANDRKIVAVLKSGTAVQVLDVDRDNGYSRVRGPGGKEGWVLSRYLMDDASAREQLLAAARQVTDLQRKNTDLQQELTQIDQLQATTDRLQRENSGLSTELDEIRKTASDTLSINEENKSLKEAISNLIREKDSIERENIALKDNTEQQWFIRGAGVILAGIVIGLIIPKIRWRRRRGWGEL